ncbi:ABC transporter substrate-binding protein [Microbacterium sp. NPDC058062]|uniref:ABC transporter substrate-binding protein n=1 Tax=Microbacterium sp. NPDC058062 TaxID=3346320 RepID=UPI0036DEEB3A
MTPTTSSRSRGHLRVLGAVAAASAAVLILSACAGGSAQTSTAAASSTLNLGSTAQPVGYDTDSLQSANYLPYFQAVYDSLVRMEPDGTLVPMLATDWAFSDDRLTLTMKLRDDVTFTDKTPFDGEAVKANLDRYRVSTAPDASFLKDITEVEVVGEHEVAIHLSAPNPALPTYFTRAPGLMISPTALDQESLKTEPIGSGPYVLDQDQTVIGSKYVYTRNDDYWDPDLVKYDSIVFNYFADPNASLNALRSGQIDAAPILVPDASVVEGAGFTINETQFDWLGLTFFDRAGAVVPALGDVRVRQALNYAVDGDEILAAIGEDRGTSTTQIFSKDSAGFMEDLDDAYPYDPDKARELLDEAGYVDRFTLSMPTTAFFDQAIYATVKQQLADVGVTVEYTDVGQDLIADLKAAEFPATVMQFAQPIDWQLINEYLTTGASWNVFKVDDPTANEIIARVQTGTDEESAAATVELNEYVVEQAWFAPWYRIDSLYATDADTTVQMQANNVAPYIYNYAPAS